MLPASFHQPAIPRLLPHQPLPPRTYIPGRTTKLLPSEYELAINSEMSACWSQSSTYCWGCELFNHGYYWEAHEVWEGLWHALGRTGQDADFLKGLIKLAAAGVKVREGRPEGVIRHGRRAMELFRTLLSETEQQSPASYGGLSLFDLVRVAETVLAAPPSAPESDAAMPLFAFALLPSLEGGSP
jgi:hypothetical protein